MGWVKVVMEMFMQGLIWGKAKYYRWRGILARMESELVKTLICMAGNM
jgi:hypothetical protein